MDLAITSTFTYDTIETIYLIPTVAL